MVSAFPDSQFRRFAQMLRFFTEASMDQWERWRFKSRHGDVFVSIRRFPEPGAPPEAYDDITASTEFDPSLRQCRRCGRPVASSDYAHISEHMHYVCFHYEFEHGDIDVDEECTAGGCPSAGVTAVSGCTRFEVRDHRRPLAEHHRAMVVLSDGGVDIEMLEQDEGQTQKVVLSELVE